MSKRSPRQPGPWREFVLLDVILPVKAFFAAGYDVYIVSKL